MEEKAFKKGNLIHFDYVLELWNTTGCKILVHSCMVKGIVCHILESKEEIFSCICADFFCELAWELGVRTLHLEISIKHRSAHDIWACGLTFVLLTYVHHLLATHPETKTKDQRHRMQCCRAHGADSGPRGPFSHTAASTGGLASLFTSFLGVIVLTSNSGNSVHFSPSARCRQNIWLSGCVMQAL